MALINTTTTGVLGSTFFGDGTGSLTVQQNGVTLGTYGNIPTFAASRITSDQTGTASTYVKVQFQSELFDTANCYDNTTNYRFTPNVAGYYLFNATVLNNPSAGTQTQLVTKIYKNGSSSNALANHVNGAGIGGGTSLTVTEIYFMNGTTDYAEVYQYSNATTPTYQSGSYFTGFLFKAT
jgi:hypothetical protein